jgi:hypothetical protein
MTNFQDELEALVDEWIGKGDTPESMISDLQGEVDRLRLLEKEQEQEDGDEDDAA